MYLISLILLITSALMLTNASAPPAPRRPDTVSTPASPSETPIVITETAMCTNKTYIYCSHHDLTGDWQADLVRAASGLDHFCPAHMIDPHKYYRTMWGTTQVYICNYDDSLLGCSHGEFRAASALLDDKCGEGAGGWMYRKTEDHAWSVGRDPTLRDGVFRSECGMW
ncbi:hypothetical protein KVR01_009010 [Diaporthe batatas]|uniref:uncharacterized protein n=1 Tax=Diaporthe batatas TaxID=748121 RepID=UPI001D05A63F|nr:uncharacterized protein KVR01_009010 [Diaporthe batatas]KAG8160746.1 hypothetical protein KVR01_009010 [Diaporthe batatas]